MEISNYYYPRSLYQSPTKNSFHANRMKSYQQINTRIKQLYASEKLGSFYANKTVNQNRLMPLNFLETRGTPIMLLRKFKITKQSRSIFTETIDTRLLARNSTLSTNCIQTKTAPQTKSRVIIELKSSISEWSSSNN